MAKAEEEKKKPVPMPCVCGRGGHYRAQEGRRSHVQLSEPGAMPQRTEDPVVRKRGGSRGRVGSAREEL